MLQTFGRGKGGTCPRQWNLAINRVWGSREREGSDRISIAPGYIGDAYKNKWLNEWMNPEVSNLET